MVGFAHESIEVGIDGVGNAKLQEGSTIIGLLFLVIPIAGHSDTEVRFVKTR